MKSQQLTDQSQKQTPNPALLRFISIEIKTQNTLKQVIYYHNDHLGSTGVVTNESGDIVEETFYEPFGSIISGGELTMFDYEGREFSELTGDYDFRFRKYDSSLGIFTQPDAGIQDIYDPQALNRYAFERNNPYLYVDENGREPVTAITIYVVAETVIDVISLGVSIYFFLDEPRSKINQAALFLDITDLTFGPISNPGPSGFLVRKAATSTGDVAERFGVKTTSQTLSYYLSTVEKDIFLSNKFEGHSSIYLPNLYQSSPYYYGTPFIIDETSNLGDSTSNSGGSGGAGYYRDPDSGECVCGIPDNQDSTDNPLKSVLPDNPLEAFR